MVLIGITRMESWIDPALRRPGRLERSVLLSFPDHDARRRILLEELRELRYKSQNDYADLSTLECLLDRAANETEGFTGAALIAVCDFAKMQASKEYFLTRSGNMSTSTSYVTGNEPFVTPRLILNAIYEHKGGRQA
jgi:transitional endoplasmic reticulum ATPase